MTMTSADAIRYLTVNFPREEIIKLRRRYPRPASSRKKRMFRRTGRHVPNLLASQAASSIS